MNLTLAITTFNRFQYLCESFEQVIDHSRITEIILMDDCSDLEIFKQIEQLKKLSPNIIVYRQAQNRNMGYNKYSAVAHASNEWVILFDSDNVLTMDYIDHIPDNPLKEMIIHPDFAKPNFDFRKFHGRIGHYIDKQNMKTYFKDGMFWTMLNACNYVVNRDEYTRVYKENASQKGSDTVWFNYLWLKAGNGFYVVPGMEYEHRMHDQSGFLQDAWYNMSKAEEVKKLIMAL